MTRLLALAAASDEIDDILELEASIPERVYLAMPEDLRRLVSDARTLKHAKEVIEIEGIA